jgi:poly(beta-D-mannuronate) lyase
VPSLGANGAETIQIGQRAIPHSDLRPETLVEDNEFVRCNGEAEIISVKTSGNIIRNNRFRDCKGELVMRHGHNNTITGNQFEGGSGGIRLSGQAHVVAGNAIIRCSGTGIRLYYGTPDVNHPASYLPVYDCVITDNTIVDCGKAGILVGDIKNAHYEDKKWASRGNTVMDCTVAPYHNRIVHNTVTGAAGKLIKVEAAPENTIADNTLTEKP